MRPSLRLALAALCAASPLAGRAQFPITESFMGTTAPGWTLLGNATLTAASGVDPAGQGWLRLTRTTLNQAGSAIYNTAFSSSRGILVTFDYADYGGTGADGFSFYLVDGATGTPTVGSPGGSLGYAAKYSNATCATGPLTATSAGVTNGYVGIGFDEWGNFSACESGYNAPGLTPQSVVIRGSGSLSAGTAFRWLTGRQISALFGHNIDGVARAAPRKVRISIVNQIIRVDMDFGAGFQTVVPSFDLAAPGIGQAALPATFKMGFSGSTGGSTNTHEIRNISVTQPLNLSLTQSVNPNTVAVGGTLTYTIVVANDNSNIADPVTIADAFPAGLSNVAWSVAALTGGATVATSGGSGNLSDTLHLPRNSSVTFTVTATVLPSAAGTTLSNTVTVVPPSGSTNLLSNTSATVLDVTPMASATGLASSVNPSAFGESTTLTATVTSPVSGTPSGTVTFLDGATVLGTAPLGGSGVATLAVSSLAVGAHPTLHASYGGATAYLPSTSPDLLQTVIPSPTATALTVAPAPSIAGQAVTLSALVTVAPPGAGLPGGTVTFRDGATVLGTAPLDGSGAASLGTAVLLAGTHLLTATYEGATSFDPSTSPPWTQVVSRATAVAVLAASPNPSARGQVATLTAAVAPRTFGIGTPGGSVTFLDGAASLGTVVLDGSGVATLPVSSLAVGTHTLTVAYLGDAGYAPSTSAPVSQVVTAAPTSTVLGASPNPSVLGQTVTLTATVAAVPPGAGTPTGTVTFRDGGASLGSASLVGGVATLTTSALAQGGHTLTAAYAATTDFQASTSTGVAQVVNPGATTVALLAAPSPAISGEPVELRVQVSATAPAAGIPGGTVTFLSDGLIIGTAPLDATGRAVLPAGFLVGTHLLTVTYSGSGGWLPGASGDVLLPVGQGAADAGLTTSLSPSTYGDAVTLTATVTAQAPATGTPSGTVTFHDGATVLGSATLVGGQATFVTSALATGSHDLTARYQGDPEFLPVTSPITAQVVTPATPAVALASSAPAPAFGDPVVLTATVAGPLGPATGTVTFRDGATVLCQDVPLVNGVASCGPLAPAVGTHAYAADYAGDDNHVAGSGGLSLPVAPAPTATTLGAAPGPSVTGQVVTLLATVAATNGAPGVPSGTVTFRDGATVLATVPLDASGSASLSISSLGVGGHSLTATYDASPDFAGSVSAPAVHQVNPAPTSLALAALPSPATYGGAVTLSAAVAALPPGAGAPGGTVTFLDGATVLGTAPVGPGGVSTLPIPGLATGSHALTAVYSGDASFLPSNGATGLQVSPATPSVALLSSANPSVSGDAVPLTATVSGPLGPPTGTVTFLEGATALCGPVPLVGGVASCSATGLAAGPHTLTAAYSGDADHASSTSAPLSQVVLRASSSISLASTVNPTVFGQPTTLTATVSSAAGTPTGSVTFLDGATLLGTAPLDGSGIAILPVAGLAVGTHPLTARFEGDSDRTPSTSTPVSQVVTAAPTSTVLGASPNPSVLGQTVTLTATVAAVPPGAGTPTGTVTFRNGGASLGSAALVGGVATLTTSALAQGGHTLTAAYAGTTDFQASTSTGIAQVVNPGATTVALLATPSPAISGEPVELRVQVSAAAPATGIPDGTVTFLSDGVVIGTAPLDATGRAVLPAGFLVGTHVLTVTYGGSARWLPGASGDVLLPVGQGAADAALATSLSPSTYGDAVTLTATVSAQTPATGTPGGTVTFYDGATALGSATLVGGQATFVTSALAAGPHDLTARYQGGTEFLPVTSPVTAQVVTPATPAVVLASSAPAPAFGDPVVLTATVAGPLGPATGTVTFRDGATVLCQDVPLVNGVASCGPLAPAVGTHAYAADYAGDGNHIAGSGGLSLPVAPAPTATTLGAAPGPSVTGQVVTLLATVAATNGAPGVPSGTVTFRDGATVLATVPLDASGTASLPLSSLGVGGHSLTATYDASPDFAGSVSAPTGHQVTPAPTSLALAASPSPATYGGAVTLSAAVAALPPGAGAPGGTVTFLDGATVLGTAPVGPGGVSTLPIPGLATGSHALTAVYSGDASFLPSNGATGLQVSPATPSVALLSSANPSVSGDAVPLTATVSGPLGPPTGTVTFLEGATALCGPVPLVGGVASCSATGLAAGPHTLTAAYSGDADHASSTSAPLSQVVLRASSSISLASTVNPTVFGQPTTLTATASSATGTPTGSITFLDGATLLGTAALDGSGVAILPVAGLAVGTHPLTARFEGDSDRAPSTSAPVSQVVSKAATTTALAVAPSPSGAFQPVTLTATVAPVAPGAGTPTGTVTFRDGGVDLGTAALDATGHAAFAVSTLAPGTHALTAVYGGDGSFEGSATAGAVTQSVSKGPVVVTLVPLPSPSVFGQAVTLSVGVSSSTTGAPTATGTVTIQDGAFTLATLPLAAGAASTTVASLAVGGHALTASYGGDAVYLPGTGPAAHRVDPAATSTALTSSLNPSRVGQAVTFTATVSVAAPGAGTPTGTVAFADGATVLCAAAPLSGGTATCAAPALPAGSHAVSAAYSGDVSFSGSSGGLAQSVGKTSTALALTPSPSPSMFGQAVVLTALVTAVAPGSGIPTGAVTFSDGTTTLGSSALDGTGRATLTTSTLPAGARALSASYPGDAGYLASSGTAAHTVQPGSTTVTVTSSRNPSRFGRPVTFTAAVTSPHATPAGSVDFKEGSTVLGTATLAADGKAAITLADLRKGTHPVTAVFTPTADFAAASGDLAGGQVVENTPPVAGAGTALALAPAAAASAQVDAASGRLDLAAMTLELWARAGWSTTGEVTGTPGLFRLGPAARARLSLEVAPDRRSLRVGAGTSATTDVPAALDDGAWHHLAVAADTQAIAVWVDGAQVGHVQGGLDDTARGGTLALGAGFVGEVDEVRVWEGARGGAQLSATSRQPLRGDEAGLAGCWRMDEGDGLEIFDAGPHHLSGTLPLGPAATAGTNPFTPSGAWRHREVWQERDLAPPVAAGYDADGDPLTLTLVSPAAHGATSVDATALRIGYHPADGFLGADGFTYRLDDGTARSDYVIDLTVKRILVCGADADCGGGDLCVQATCRPPADLVARAGGCGCGGGDGGALALWSLLGLVYALRPRSGAAPRRTGGRS